MNRHIYRSHTTHTCKICSQTFNKYFQLENHIETKHRQAVDLTCPKCGKKPGKTSLKVHTTNYHKEHKCDKKSNQMVSFRV